MTEEIQTFYMDGYLKENLDTAKKVIVKDWDMLFAVDGSEGSGKSVFTMQIAYYCDPTLCLDRIVFTPDDFKRAVLNAGKYQAIIYDEAYTGLSSRAAMSKVNRILVQMLAEIRQKNLFIFIVMPTFFDLDKYVALWRSRALIHIYTGDNFERGRFAFYNVDKKKDLYINGKKYYSYAMPRPNFIGRFSNYYPIDKEEYKKKKANVSTERELSAAEEQLRQELEERLFVKLVESDLGITHEVKAKILEMPISTYYYKLRKYEEGKEFNTSL